MSDQREDDGIAIRLVRDWQQCPEDPKLTAALSRWFRMDAFALLVRPGAQRLPLQRFDPRRLPD